MRVSIFDSSSEISCKLLSWLANNKKVTEITFFDEENEFIKSTEELKPDVVFINVDLDETSCAKLAETLKSQNASLRIVSISENTKFAVDAYEIGVYGYLLVPLEKQKFDRIMSIVQDNILEGQVRQYLEQRSK